MTPRERVYAALRGERVDRIPFTIYGGLLPRSETERLLRNEGLCLVDRIPVFSCSNPTVEFERREFWCEGRLWVRQTYWTPVGEVTELLRTGGGYGTSLRQEFLIKRPEDYEVLRYMVAHEVYTPAYAEFLAHQAMVGEELVVGRRVDLVGHHVAEHFVRLLYTSHAADALPLVDLGVRRHTYKQITDQNTH